MTHIRVKVIICGNKYKLNFTNNMSNNYYRVIIFFQLTKEKDQIETFFVGRKKFVIIYMRGYFLYFREVFSCFLTLFCH